MSYNSELQSNNAELQEILDEVNKLPEAGAAEADSVPDYWVDELDAKADAIQQAMETAGSNKSAFLWYTDAHWQHNSKMSPLLLKYLAKNTPINKVNFGGDIVCDPASFTHDNVKYVYEWRNLIADLPNHHSVYGNHDVNHRNTSGMDATNNIAYALLLAPEETPDMVIGGDSYYYIDNPAEKTRYLYLSYTTRGIGLIELESKFIVDALSSVKDGWHIVAIGHRWWNYTSSSTPTIGSVPEFEAEVLAIFDAYNARTTRNATTFFGAADFTNAKGKVEFCIGGHIHVDYDFSSDGGIPVIITAADTNQERVPDDTDDCGTLGTITESAVFGIIADYTDAESTKINVVGVGRGTSRVVRPSGIKPTSISNITYSGDTTIGVTIDKSKFSFTVGYSNGTTDTVNGATSVSPATIDVVGNNTVTITYTEGATTLSGTVTIVGTAVPVVNLLNLDRTFETGVSGASFGVSHFDESKAYTNVAYSTNNFASKDCTVSNVSENGITYTEAGVGGVAVAYYVHLPDIKTKSYNISLDYTGNSSSRVYYKYVTDDGTFSSAKTALYQSGSGHIDYVIPKSESVGEGDFTGLVIYLNASTGKTTTLSNVLLTKAQDT